MKYGFLSANIGGSGRSLYSVQAGDIFIAGSEFVGVGECLATAVPITEFAVDVNGTKMSVTLASWDSEEAKAKLNQNKEIFFSIK